MVGARGAFPGRRRGGGWLSRVAFLVYDADPEGGREDMTDLLGPELDVGESQVPSPCFCRAG